MKKTAAIITALILISACLLLVSCSERYGAGEGGRIERLENGELIAISDNGYRFAGWSDGVTEPYRAYEKTEDSVTAEFEPICVKLYDGETLTESVPISELDELETEDVAFFEQGRITLRAYFCANAEALGLAGKTDAVTELCELYKTSSFRDLADIDLHASYLDYEAGEGGELSRADGKIYAKAKNGFRFSGWTDGSVSAERSDTHTADGLYTRALFEPVSISFFVGDWCIKSAPVSELEGFDVSTLRGYKSGADFVGWEDGDKQAPDIESILKKYEKGELAGAEDYSFKAVFSESGKSGFFSFKTIAHALGGAGWRTTDRTYINDLNVFEYNYNEGHRFFEIDLLLTRDGGIVASHDYESEVLYADFMARASEDFAPIDLAGFVKLMADHPDVYMDIDILSVYRSTYNGSAADKLTAFYSALDAEIRARDKESPKELYEDIYSRIVLEIFFEEPTHSLSLELAKSGEYGFKHFMYAGVGDKEFPMGESIAELEKLCEWCRDNGVTMLSTKICTEEFIALTKEYGIYTFAYTFNDPKQIQKLLESGIDCVFTDFVCM